MTRSNYKPRFRTPSNATDPAAPRSPTDPTSPNDREFWVASRYSRNSKFELHGPFDLFTAFDTSDRIKRQFGLSGQVSTVFRAGSRDDALKAAASNVAGA